MSMYTCSGCSYTTNIRSNVAKHIKTVTKCFGSEMVEIVKKLSCPGCSKEFNNQTYLKQHQPRCKAGIDTSSLDGESTEGSSNLQMRLEALERTMSQLLKSHNDQEVLITKQQEQIIRLTKLCTKDVINKETDDSPSKPIKPVKPTEKQVDNPIKKNKVIYEYQKCDNYLEKRAPKMRDEIFLRAIRSSEPICTLVDGFYFNPKLPMFHCMYVANKRDRDIKIYEDNCWQTKKAETVTDIVSHCQLLINDWAAVVDADSDFSCDDQGEPDPYENDKRAYHKKMEKMGEDYDPAEDNKILDSVLLVLYNKNDLVKP